MSLDPKNESSLIAWWKSGDDKAFDQLFKLHFHKLHLFAFRHTNDPELSEELVMDMMLKVWQKKETLEANKESLAPFLFHILKAAIVDNYRKKRIEFISVEEMKQEMQYSIQADDKLLGKELSSLYQESLNYLSPQKRLVFEMRKEQGMTYKEIARELNISSKTVDRHLSDSIAIVRKYLHKHTEIVMLLGWLFFF